MSNLGSCKPKRIGIIGFGSLGQYLYQHLKDNPAFLVVFIWNRSPEKLVDLPQGIILSDLKDFANYSPELIIEVAHPSITHEFGPEFLQVADYFVGSPTAFAVQQAEDAMRKCAVTNGIYVPSGALWGAGDIKKMANRGTLESIRVTMIKHPSAFKLTGELKQVLEASDVSKPVTLYDGPVRELCPLAPQNVNTMAAASLAGLGFDKTIGCLATDPSFDKHRVVIEVVGCGGFKVTTTRDNPAKAGAVTGQATYASFLGSILEAGGKGPGLHLC